MAAITKGLGDFFIKFHHKFLPLFISSIPESFSWYIVITCIERISCVQDIFLSYIMCIFHYAYLRIMLMSYRHFPCSFHLSFDLKILTIVWKNIRKSVFVAVQDSCTYAGTKVFLNDHYLCETFCLGWAIYHCNTTPMWGLISLQVLTEH